MHDPLDIIRGKSASIEQLKSLIRQVATTDITVLVTGESGTGKELVAQSIHALSHRANGQLVTVNCGAIPEGIFESEIFGHEKGAFTSADQRRRGYFEMADNGTLFLDEIGETPLQVQVKLLRVLETGRFIRVGGSSELKVNVRLIAATNKDLAFEVTRGQFRQDLYYRLKAVNITLPPLRERPEDIPDLIQHFSREFGARNRSTMARFDQQALDLLNHYYWEGNIRELKNFVESMLALNTTGVITVDKIRSRLGYESRPGNLPMIVTKAASDSDRDLIYRTLLELRQDMHDLKNQMQQLITRTTHREIEYVYNDAEEIDAITLDDVEREQIRKVLNDFSGNRRKAAEALRIGERTLYRKIKQYGL